uniref:Gag-like protein n=1 Tax=Melicertus latisulcatus pemonivirus TaxID=2984278 RepID=A0A9C7BW16_9VIRU|nr:MAG: hypothetical protein [Melicertus latisulcatus pemonivirus]
MAKVVPSGQRALAHGSDLVRQPNMVDHPATPIPSPQAGRATPNSYKTTLNTDGTPTNDRPRSPSADIAPENARCVNIRCVNENQSLRNLNPFILKKALDGQVKGSFDFVSKLRDGSLLVKVQLKSQIKDLLKVTQINDLNVKVTILIGPNTCKGVIFHRDLRAMEESEILEAMNGQRVLDVSCMTKMDGNVRVKTGLYFLTFSTPKIPSTVKIGFEIVQVRPYIHKPKRCNRCQKFGHTSFRCIDKDTDKFTCGKCTGPHDTTTCTEKTLKCANCGGPHQSGYAECCTLKKESETSLYMREYREDKKKVEGLANKPNTFYASAVTNNVPNASGVSQQLAAKDQEIAELKETIKDLLNQIEVLNKTIKEIAESTQQKQHLIEDDTKSNSG